MTLYRFRAEALSPVHIGAGEEIDPTSFTLRDGRLLRFNASRVLADMDDAARRKFEQLLSGGAGRNAAEVFRQVKDLLARHVDPVRHGAGWIDVGEIFRQTWAELGARGDRQFRVQVMPRNPLNGRVYLPGSSMKGAIRTAVVSSLAAAAGVQRPATRDPRALARAARDMEHGLLGQFETDPFRLVDVEDAPLPDGATRIDRVFNWNPQKQGSEGVQMWHERLKSHADGQAMSFTVRLHIDEAAMAHPQVRGILKTHLTIRGLADAVNRFYWNRLRREQSGFFGDDRSPINQALLRQLALAGDDGKWRVAPIRYPRLLLRLGRFSQFESLSAEGVRVGHRPQRRGTDAEWITDPQMGWTRNLCEVTPANTGGPNRMPFGWILLTLEGAPAE